MFGDSLVWPDIKSHGEKPVTQVGDDPTHRMPDAMHQFSKMHPWPTVRAADYGFFFSHRLASIFGGSELPLVASTMNSGSLVRAPSGLASSIFAFVHPVA